MSRLAESSREAPGSPDGGPGTSGDAHIGWLRAALSAAAILLVGVLGCVYVPNMIVTKVDGLSPDARSDIAAGLCLTILLLMAWGLRRLQARHLI